MRRSGDDHEAVFPGEAGDDAAQARDVLAGFLDVATNASPDLDHRLNHFRLDLLAEQHLAFLEDLGDVRTQFARLRIDDLKFFLDAQRELIEHSGPLAAQEFKCLAIMRQSGFSLPRYS